MNNPQSDPKAKDALPEAPTQRLDPSAVASSELVRLLDEYLHELEAGRQPDRAKLVTDHPQWAAQLEPALAGLDFIHGAQQAEGKPPERLGDFRVVREIGRGGMGVVYEAEQISLKRKVALKVLRLAHLPDREALQRFQREAETVGGLHHTNIVPIYAIGQEAGVPYYAMQFIEGRSLTEVIEDEASGPVPPDYDQVADWGWQAAEALAHAHQRGVIHRDVKPSNLILDREGRIWLTDFGLAKRAEDLTLSLTGALLGTPRYMSPEQASAMQRPVDHRTDLYSLGVTLYELVTRRPIFEANSPDVIITQILTADPPAPRQLAPGLPRDLETIILKCLEKDPVRRYAGAREMADDLRAFREGRPIQARRPRWTERAARWARKHKRGTLIASLSAGATLVLLVGAGRTWDHMRRARLGYITLTTSGENLAAEILDGSDNSVVAPILVPTSDPVALPAGSYRLRLSSSGLLSETWPLEIKQGVRATLPVQLRRRRLWSPLELNEAQYPEIELADLDASVDLIQIIHMFTDQQGATQRRLRRLHGATGLPAWERDLIFEAPTLPAGRDLSEWRKLLARSGTAGADQGSLLVPERADLNGDGTGDLVWLSRTTPSLLALSGSDGSLLWWHRSRSMPSAETSLARDDAQPSVEGAVVGRALALELDGDGVVDYVVCMTSQPGTLRAEDGRSIRTPRQGWVEAVSGRAGQTLWRRPLGDPWPELMNDSRAARRWHGLARPLLDTSGGERRVLLLQGSRLLSLNARDGTEAVPPLELNFEPWQAPRLLSLGSNQPPAVLFLHSPKDNRERLTLTAFDLRRRQTLWQKSFLPMGDLNPADDPQRNWFYLESLGPEESPLVIVPVQSSSQSSPHFRSVCRLEAWRAEDGQRSWSVPLADRVESPPRGLAGPDIDGDGRREFFLVTQVGDWVHQRTLLGVTAHAGVDGRILWEQRYPHSGVSSWPDPSGPLAWWHGTVDDWPLLVVPVHQGGGFQPFTLFYSAQNGRLDHVLSDVERPRLADLDGDGLLDIFHTVSPQSAPRGLTIKGRTPETWRRLGSWEPAVDADQDGFTDLISRESSVRSGRDGTRLYHLDLNRSPSGHPGPLSAPQGDLDGDGISDLVLSDVSRKPGLSAATSSQRAESQPTYSAFSGRSGAKLWTAPYFGMAGGGSSGSLLWQISYPALAAVDLDKNGTVELLVMHGHRQNGTLLTALEGASGQVRWQLPAVPGTFPSLMGNLPPQWDDLNGDGTADPVLWSPASDKPAPSSALELRAYDGRNGQELWRNRDVAPPEPGQLGWPQIQSFSMTNTDAAQVFILVHHGYEPKHSGYHIQLTSVDGRSGVPRWTHAWSAGFPELLPPIAVRVNHSTRWVAMGMREGDAAHLVLLDAQGSVQRRWPLPLGPSQFYVAQSLWRAVDVDGDGRDELLSERGGNLCVWQVDRDEPLWNWPLPGRTSQVLRFDPATATRPALISIWTGRSVYGLEATTGKPLWRGDVDAEPARAAGVASVGLLEMGPKATRPGLLFYWPQAPPAYSWFTAARQTWPCTEDGRFAPKMPIDAAAASRGR